MVSIGMSSFLTLALHIRPAPRHAYGYERVRRTHATMFRREGGKPEQDVYGFEEVELPPLPSGVHLTLEEGKQSELDTADYSWASDEEEARMWRKIETYVTRHEADFDAGDYGTGGEIWPSAAALCEWLSNHSAEIKGTRVLELGCGTGACGIFAAALGASSVQLTDGGSEKLLALTHANVALNQQHIGPGVQIAIRRLDWNAAEDAACLAAPFDVLLASDVIFGHAAEPDEASNETHTALARTIGLLLRRQGSSAARPPSAILAHEHRSRSALLDAPLGWDEDDAHLRNFLTAAASAGLRVRCLWSRRPTSYARGRFRSWTADVSIMEVSLV